MGKHESASKYGSKHNTNIQIPGAPLFNFAAICKEIAFDIISSIQIRYFTLSITIHSTHKYQRTI